MLLVDEKITLPELKQMAEKMYNRLVKVVVDSEKNIMVVDAGLHADEEDFLLTQGSDQQNLWGLNLYPYKFGTDGFIEFDSMINIRPSWGNSSRGIDDPAIQQKIIKIVNNLVIP